MSAVFMLRPAIANTQTLQKFSAVTTVRCCFRRKLNQFVPRSAFHSDTILSLPCGSPFGNVLKKPGRRVVLKCRSISSSSRCESLFGEDKMASAPAKCLESLDFINTAVRSLPIDDIKENYVRTVPGWLV